MSQFLRGSRAKSKRESYLALRLGSCKLNSDGNAYLCPEDFGACIDFVNIDQSPRQDLVAIKGCFVFA